jgi:hypothetical protein
MSRRRDYSRGHLLDTTHLVRALTGDSHGATQRTLGKLVEQGTTLSDRQLRRFLDGEFESNEDAISAFSRFLNQSSLHPRFIGFAGNCDILVELRVSASSSVKAAKENAKEEAKKAKEEGKKVETAHELNLTREFFRLQSFVETWLRSPYQVKSGLPYGLDVIDPVLCALMKLGWADVLYDALVDFDADKRAQQRFGELQLGFADVPRLFDEAFHDLRWAARVDHTQAHATELRIIGVYANVMAMISADQMASLALLPQLPHRPDTAARNSTFLKWEAELKQMFNGGLLADFDFLKAFSKGGIPLARIALDMQSAASLADVNELPLHLLSTPRVADVLRAERGGADQYLQTPGYQILRHRNHKAFTKLYGHLKALETANI